MVPGPDGSLIQDPSFAPPPVEGFIDPGVNFVGIAPDGDPATGGFPPAGDPVFESPLDQAFQPAPAPEPAPFDPVAHAVGGAADAAAPQGPAPAPDPVTAPVAPEPEPAPEVADVPPPPEDPVVG